MRGLSTFSGCWWTFGFTFTSLLPQMLPQICEIWLKSNLMQVCKPCHYKAVEPFQLLPTSMSYMYEVFEHLLTLWMGGWLHTHTITTTDASPDMLELAEILADASVQTMPLCFGWGCRTFQTASHVHVIHIWGVWAPSQVVDGHMSSHLHRAHHRCFSRLGKVGWIPKLYKFANHATTLWLRLLNLSNCILHLCHTFIRCLSAFSGTGWAYGFTLTLLPPHTLPQILESRLKSDVMQLYKPCHYTLVEAVEPFKLLCMFIAYIYDRFKHLLRLWMGIRIHIHIITATDTSPDLWEFAKIQPDASVQTMPLQGYRTFSTTSHVHVINIWGVWAPSQVVDGHMTSHSHRYHHRCFPRFGKVGWNPTRCKCTNHATLLWWLRL